MISKIKLAYGNNYNAQLQSDSLARIINEIHFNRLIKIIDENKDAIIFGGESDDNQYFIQPTLIKAEGSESKSLNEEIFGPLLPIYTYDTEKNLSELINNINNPLSLYIFSNSREFISNIEDKTSSGSLCINDIASQFINHNLPFGGVMGSGIGRYHGFAGFKEFSNIRSVTHQSKLNFLSILKAPYTDNLKKIVNLMLKFYQKI